MAREQPIGEMDDDVELAIRALERQFSRRPRVRTDPRAFVVVMVIVVAAMAAAVVLVPRMVDTIHTGWSTPLM